MAFTSFSRSDLYKIVSYCDSMPFGQYRGVEVGLIYLFDPNYLEWAICNTDFALSDIEYLQKLKVIYNWSAEDSILITGAIGKKEYLEEHFNWFSFEDLKYSGTEKFEFSRLALQKNSEKRFSPKNFKDITKIDESDIIYFQIFTDDLFVKKSEYTCKGYDETKKGMKYYILEVDNKNNLFPKLPKIIDCKIGIRQFNKDFKLKIGTKYLILKEGDNISFEDI